MRAPSNIEAATEKKVILAFRLQGVLVVLAILAVSDAGYFLTGGAFKVAAAYLASNAVLAFFPARHFQSKRLVGAIFVMDVLFVSTCIHLSRNVTGDIYLLYFLAIFMAAMSRDLRTTLVAALVVSAVYLSVSISALGIPDSMSSGFLMRIPLFFVTAFFAGFLASQARQREIQHQKSKKMAARLERELEKEILREEEALNRYDDLRMQHWEVISSINQGIIVVGADGIITAFNPEAQRMSGVSAEEALGRRIAVVKGLAPLLPHVNGALQSSHTCSVRGCAFSRDGGDSPPVELSASPMFGREGAMAGAVLTLRDQAEVDDLHDRISRYERFIYLGETAACMARDIREPLHSIISIARLQCERTDESDKFHQFGQGIIGEAARIYETVAAALQLIRADSSSFESLDLNEIIRSCVQGMRSELERLSISLTLDLDPYLPLVTGSAMQLRQVFYHLTINAIQAVGRNGGVRISTCVKGGRVVGTLEDDGPGVPEAMREKLFRPLFTSKREGIGLGLSVSRQIMTDHGGEIEYLPGRGRGAAFEIRFPSLSAERSETAA